MQTSIRVVPTGTSARCGSWTTVPGPVTVVCVILDEIAEWVTVLVKVA